MRYQHSTTDASLRAIATLSLILMFCCLAPAIQAISLTIDHVDGLWGTDTLLSNRPVTFHLRLTNNGLAAPVAGHMNGFQLYSPDGAIWAPAAGDTVSLGWPTMFDLVWEIMSYSATGSEADTIAFGGARQDSAGLPDGFDQVGWMISTQLNNDQHGLTLCLDSAFFPPSGWWQWTYGDGIGRQYPEWAGPHCYTIVADTDADSIPDIFDNCPGVANTDQTDFNDDGVGNACDCCVHRGDINHDGTPVPDIADLIYMVTFMFQEGPEPICDEPYSPECSEHYFAETDVDGNWSCAPDIADLIYLVVYMFQEGPAPVPCP